MGRERSSSSDAATLRRWSSVFWFVIPVTLILSLSNCRNLPWFLLLGVATPLMLYAIHRNKIVIGRIALAIILAAPMFAFAPVDIDVMIGESPGIHVAEPVFSYHEKLRLIAAGSKEHQDFIHYRSTCSRGAVTLRSIVLIIVPGFG